MALIKCPNCGKQYSEHAEKCPKCGLTLQDAQDKASKRKSNIKKVLLFVGIPALVLASILIIPNEADNIKRSKIPHDIKEIAPGKYAIVNIKGKPIKKLDYQKAFYYKAIKDKEHTDDVNNYPSACWLTVQDYNNKWGIIDISGNVIIPLEYDKITEAQFFNGTCIVEKGGKYGVVGKDGSIVLPIEYDSIQAHIEPDGTAYDKNGRECVIKNKARAYYTVAKNGKVGVITNEGKTIIPLEYSEVNVDGFKCRIIVYVTSKIDGYTSTKCGLADFFNGAILLPPKYSHIYDKGYDTVELRENNSVVGNYNYVEKKWITTDTQ